MPRRIDLGRAVLILGSALLFISLFLKWYDTGPTGWEVFEALDLVLAALAAAGLVAALRPDALSPAAAWGLPAAALLIVLVQLVNPPPAAAGADPSTGAWLALLGALLMAAGAAMSLAAISVTVQVRERDVRRRVAAVDRRAEREDAAAADLDADAAAVAGNGSSGTDAPGGRLWQREGGAVRASEPVSGTPAPGRPEAADLERTQPLTALSDAEDADRS
ncbi:MAG: hypothetical protein QOF86_4483 [Baekduia sp.]|jgi:hypothetical protein|nr:hypothetical protein [Baekduia sp.]